LSKPRKRKTYSVTSKNRNVLKLPKPPTQEVTDSFRLAFFVKQLTYTNKLVYDKTTVKLNIAAREPNLQKLSQQN
jgi:hypothetical protein